MRIAICDDEQEAVDVLTGYIERYDTQKQYQVETFLSSAALLSSVQSAHYDIVFLDIEMSVPNGFDTAVMLKNMPRSPLVIFAARRGEYSYSGYGVVFRYLTKPIDYAAFTHVMNLAVREITQKSVCLTTSSGVLVLYLNEIAYIETQRGSTSIHMRTERHNIRLPLKAVTEILPAAQFLHTHKSFVVNLDYVKRVEQNTVTLTGNEIVPLSRSYKKPLEAALKARYVGSMLGGK